MVILINTGLRVLELAQLSLGDVSLSECKGSLYIRDGKGGKTRTVPLNAEARNALAAYLAIRPTDDRTYLFLGQRGPIRSRQLQRIVKKYTQRSGLQPAEISAHTLRHTYGRPFGRLVNISMDMTRYLERVFSPWRWRGPSISSLVSFQGT